MFDYIEEYINEEVKALKEEVKALKAEYEEEKRLMELAERTRDYGMGEWECKA
jgi:hypothetical protein